MPRLGWAGPRRREEMEEEAPVTAATGALGPVITKLAALLGSEYKLRRRTRRDVKFIRSKLKPVHSILWDIWEREQLDEASMALKMEALDLADDVDDAIVDFILSLERSLSTKRLVQTKTKIKASPFQDFKKRASDVSERCCSKWKERKKKKPADEDSSPGKPRAYPFVRRDASELVGMEEPRDKLIRYLVGEDDEGTPAELHLKTALIYGTAGMGKSTLADLVYEAIGNKFEYRAFVSVTRPGSNMREVLARILQQVAGNNTSAVPVACTEEDLIDIISKFLKDKRYLLIIDDIWNWSEWEVIMKSLPENNLGSRIVGTTRIIAVARKWLNVSYGCNPLLHRMLPEWYNDEEGWAYKIGKKNIATQMIAMKADLVAEGFDDKHPIVRMCGGTPLAVGCMLSAVAQEREKQAQQGLHAKACDVQDKIEKHVIEHGIQNTPGFEALVENLQLGFDDLPHHMLKTCLLYCSMYPDGHLFDQQNLVRRWICEGFVCEEEEANGYFDELVNRGFILNVSVLGYPRMHPVMRNFLRWKSREDNFITCSSEITPSSYNNSTCRIRRLCIEDNSPCRSGDTAVDPLSALDWYRIRSLAVDKGMERVPFEKLERVRVLDLRWIRGVQDHHLKDICGLVRLRHLLGLDGDGISKIPPEIVRLQCLDTFEEGRKGFARGLHGFMMQLEILRFGELPKEIGRLQQLKTLVMNCSSIKELPKEIGSLQQLKTLNIRSTQITVLPKEIGRLQQLKTLDISRTQITVLPKEIGSLQQLKTLNISGTQITVLPKEIGKLQQLEHLLMTDTKVLKIPREIRALKELKSLKLDNQTAVLPLEVCGAFVEELPECIHQALKKSDLMCELAREMISFRKSLVFANGGLVVGAKQMHVPPWIREHFNDIALLDITICKLEERGLKILREMPKLEELTLRFQVVPREPVLIGREGFENLWRLTVDSRVPRVTFQEGAMPRLYKITFLFQFYGGPPNKGPVGINHLRKLRVISFQCNEDWYGGGDSPCIRPTIDVVRKEAQELPRLRTFEVCGKWKKIHRQRETEQGSSSRTGETGEERSSGAGEIEEDIQA